MKVLVLISIISFSFFNAQNKNECHQKLEFGPLCSCVSDRRQDTRDDSLYEYEFEERMNKLACVDINKDSKKEAFKKIHNFWFDNNLNISCDGLSFNVSKGYILKLAAYRSFSQFLDQAVYDWKVPLNKIDLSDDRTTLDYIQNEIKKNKNQPKESALKSYYEVLKKAGAKHKSELSSEELKRNGLPDGHKECKADAPCNF